MIIIVVVARGGIFFKMRHVCQGSRGRPLPKFDQKIFRKKRFLRKIDELLRGKNYTLLPKHNNQPKCNISTNIKITNLFKSSSHSPDTLTTSTTKAIKTKKPKKPPSKPHKQQGVRG